MWKQIKKLYDDWLKARGDEYDYEIELINRRMVSETMNGGLYTADIDLDEGGMQQSWPLWIMTSYCGNDDSQLVYCKETGK